MANQVPALEIPPLIVVSNPLEVREVDPADLPNTMGDVDTFARRRLFELKGDDFLLDRLLKADTANQLSPEVVKELGVLELNACELEGLDPVHTWLGLTAVAIDRSGTKLGDIGLVTLVAYRVRHNPHYVEPIGADVTPALAYGVNQVISWRESNSRSPQRSRRRYNF